MLPRLIAKGISRLNKFNHTSWIIIWHQRIAIARSRFFDAKTNHR
ncbi:MAG: hypothetical protein PUP92_05735 [Rhizonema sp. PD38]|nr:hypothetical protein [Rhizonema sp. PD38]